MAKTHIKSKKHELAKYCGAQACEYKIYEPRSLGVYIIQTFYGICYRYLCYRLFLYYGVHMLQTPSNGCRNISTTTFKTRKLTFLGSHASIIDGLSIFSFIKVNNTIVKEYAIQFIENAFKQLPLQKN